MNQSSTGYKTMQKRGTPQAQNCNSSPTLQHGSTSAASLNSLKQISEKEAAQILCSKRTLTSSEQLKMKGEICSKTGEYRYIPTGEWVFKIKAEEATAAHLHEAELLITPCTEAQASKQILRLMVHKRVEPSFQEIILADYCKALKGFSLAALMEGVAEILKTDESAFMPQLATVLRIVSGHHAKLVAYREAVNAALNPKPALQSPTAQRLTEEARQKEELAKARAWRTKPKDKWTAADWQAYVLEAQATAETYRKFPVFGLEKVEEWETEAANRRQEWEENTAALGSNFNGEIREATFSTTPTTQHKEAI